MSSINVSLVSAASAKAQTVSLPRDMTVADLQKLAPGAKAVVFTVAGCAPAAATTLGDLFDACATDATLQVSFSAQKTMGICLPCCITCGGFEYNSGSSGGGAPTTTISTNTTLGQLHQDNPSLNPPL